MRDDIYWAADDSETAVAGCIDRIKRYQESLVASGRCEKMQRSWYAYKGQGPRGDVQGSRISGYGLNGELLAETINHYASLVNQSVVLITSNKPATRAIASNNDSESLAQAQLADAINDYYDRELGVADVELQCVRTMALFGEAAEVMSWDANLGRKIGPSEGLRPQGDVDVLALTPLDYAYDPDTREVRARTWVAFRRPVNKYDLAATFPAKKDDILASSQYNQGALLSRYGDTINAADFMVRDARRTTASESDEVWLWEVRHIPTAACPNGRLIRFLHEGCVLFDTRVNKTSETGERVTQDFGLPYSGLGVEFVAAERLPGTETANTSFFDLLSMQENIDLAASIMATAINAGGLMNLYVPEGANITADRLTGSLNIIKYSGQLVPHAEAACVIPDVVPAWAQQNIEWMRQRVGSNEVASGEPSKGMPAQAMALLRATAVEAHSGMQKAFESLIQRGRTGIIKLLQRFASTDRIALVAGRANSWTLKYFKGEDLRAFDRFVVEPINPAMKTLAGKVAFAQPLLDSGKIQLEEYLQLVATGRMEPIFHATRDNAARIQLEKELLMQGVGLPPIATYMDPMTGQMEPQLDALGLPVFLEGERGQKYVRPLITDTHWLDIPEFLGVLSQPGTRGNPAVVKAVTQVVDLKMRMLRVMPPDLIRILGGPPPLNMGMGGGSLGGAGGTSPASAPPSLSGASGAPNMPEIKPPSLPQPPQNPITKEQDQQTNLKQ